MSRTPNSRSRHHAHDSIPHSHVVETDSEDALREWHALNSSEQARFAETATMTPLAGSADPRFAPTEPAGLRHAPAAATKRPRTLEEAMVEARRLNRVCPRARAWQDLYALLPGANAADRRNRPPLPLAQASWATTPALAKRMILREQLEWADRYGGLPKVCAFMETLPEDQWQHMGD